MSVAPKYGSYDDFKVNRGCICGAIFMLILISDVCISIGTFCAKFHKEYRHKSVVIYGSYI